MTKKTIAFDADDTLWHNEPYFDEAQHNFYLLFENLVTKEQVLELILQHQVKNLPLYGFGIKAFTLSLIETAQQITNNNVSGENLNKILEIGKNLVQKPVELLPNVTEVLTKLKPNYKLIVATKGDLKDQHRKLHDSGLGYFFHHIEVMSDKTETDYTKMLNRLDCQPENFIMIGNSLKSDVLPVLNIGATGIHIPYETTWAYEKIDFKIEHQNFIEITNLNELFNFL